MEIVSCRPFFNQPDIHLVLTQGVGLAGLSSLCKLKVKASGPTEIVR